MPQILQQVSLRDMNTFGIEVFSKYYTEIHSAGDFQELVRDRVYRDNRRLVLGGGSNVLFTGDFDGLVIRNCLKGISVSGEGDEVLVTAAAGENWHQFVTNMVARGIGGLENLSLIPGCVGASPMQNIGAYGVEIKDVFVELEALSMADGSLKRFDREACRFGYRESVFKRELRDQYLISSVTFRLSKKPKLNTSYGAINSELEQMGVKKPDIRDVSAAVIRIRQSKLPDPAVTGNAGSFFKNPEVSGTKFESLKVEFPELVAYPVQGGGMKLAAGWMIEKCGLKGYRHKRAAVHDRQALVLVNRENCNGVEVLELSEIVIERVRKLFGVELEREVNIF